MVSKSFWSQGNTPNLLFEPDDVTIITVIIFNSVEQGYFRIRSEIAIANIVMMTGGLR